MGILIALAVLILSITAYISWCFRTVKQKNTTSFSKLTILSLVIANVLLIVQQLLAIAVISITTNGDTTLVVTSVATLILPLVPTITTIIICIIKFKNAAHAKKHNLTELEYYQKFILPKISSI